MIYFAQDTVSLNIKIGYTGNEDAERRIKQLQTGNSNRIELLATCAGEQVVETSLHQMFAEANVCGEWFRPTPNLLKFIVGVVAKAPQPRTQVKRGGSQTFYLAGKITSWDDWRFGIIHPDLVDNFPQDTTRNWTVQQNVIENKHHYAGPFFSYTGHGCIATAPDEHGLWAKTLCRHDPAGEDHAANVVRNCLAAIQRASILFAWIDSHDCYGTIVEIGYALASNKPVWIAGPRYFRDMWFCYKTAERVAINPFPSAKEAFDKHLQAWESES